MFRLPFKRFVSGMVLAAGLMPCFGIWGVAAQERARIVQERLGADGFPTDWKPVDFAIGKEIISATTPAVAVSGSGPSATFVTTGPRGSVDGVGVLKLGNGGESPDVWQRTTRADAEKSLVRAVSQGVASPALKEAWRRVLLTEAAPPNARDQGVRDSWLAVRADTLKKMGQYEAAWGLWRAVPVGSLNERGIAQGWVEAKLLAGQGAEACPLAKTMAAGEAAGGDWAVAMAVCQVVVPTEGTVTNPASARLSLQLVEPALRSRNPALLRILTAVQDGKPIANMGAPSAMVDGFGGAVLAAYPALVGGDILPRLPDVALRRLVGTESLPVDLRGRAAIALARQTSTVEDGKAAWTLVTDTRFIGVLPDAVVLARGTRTSGTENAEYVQAALRMGQVDTAAKALPAWLGVQGLNPAETRVRMQAQLATQALQGKVQDGLWDSWMLAQALDIQANVRQAQRTLLAIEGLGVAVPARVWGQLRDRAVPVSTLVDPAWQRLLAEAVRVREVPAVLGLISDGWVGQPPAGVVPVMMGASVEALRRIGMHDVARRVAAEAILGLPASHLLPLVPEKAPANVTPTQPVTIGADAVSGSAALAPAQPVSPGDVPGMLPPPRVEPVKKPSIRIPAKPVAPKVGG